MSTAAIIDIYAANRVAGPVGAIIDSAGYFTTSVLAQRALDSKGWKGTTGQVKHRKAVLILDGSTTSMYLLDIVDPADLLATITVAASYTPANDAEAARVTALAKLTSDDRAALGL